MQSFACLRRIGGRRISGSAALADDFKVAFFASSAQNGFNQAIYEGVQAKAKELGVETAIYDGSVRRRQAVQPDRGRARWRAVRRLHRGAERHGRHRRRGRAGRRGRQTAGDGTVPDRPGPHRSRAAGERRHHHCGRSAGDRCQGAGREGGRVLQGQEPLQRRHPDRPEDLPVRQSALRDLPRDAQGRTTTSKSWRRAKAITIPTSR